jgi:hypothetical protein
MKKIKKKYSDKERLELFCKRVGELSECKFIKETKTIGVVPTGMKLEDYLTFQVNENEPDWESIDSMLIKFRLCYAKKEPTYFYDMCSILRKRVKTKETIERIDHLRAAYSRVLKSGCGMALRINEETQVPKETIDAILNSTFHSDKNQIERCNYLKSVCSGGLYLFFMEYIMTSIEITGELYKIVKKELNL